MQEGFIRGGAGLIADKMASVLSQKVQHSKRVTAIAIINDQTQASVNITFGDGVPPTNYAHVISTIPMSCLRMVDTTQCGFDWNTQTAIRTLHYDCSVKVAIKFSTRWWESSTLANGPHFGGISSTDRPTRVVVYPSYGMHQNEDATMIASYTWAQDALRYGALAQGKGSDAETLLINRVIQDLGDMHGMDSGTLSKMVIDYKVHDWYADEYSIGT
jgi:monoamine oxidase